MNKQEKLQKKNNTTQAKSSCIFGKRGQGKTTLARNLYKGKERLIIVDTLGEHDLPMIFDSPLTLHRQLTKAPYKFQISQRYRKSDIEIIFLILQKVKDYTLVLEEADFYCKPSYTPEGLEWLIQYGRHTNVEIIATSRRPAKVSRDLTGQADYFYTFRFTEPRDLKYLSDFLGNEKAREILHLPDHKFILSEL